MCAQWTAVVLSASAAAMCGCGACGRASPVLVDCVLISLGELRNCPVSLAPFFGGKGRDAVLTDVACLRVGDDVMFAHKGVARR